MSDIRCVVCGEPWDAYGLRHGDIEKWEYALFVKGAGCPSCQGVSNGWEPESMSDIENSDEDPGARLALIEDRESRPKWERPAPVIVWECDECTACVQVSPVDGKREYSGTGRNVSALERSLQIPTGRFGEYEYDEAPAEPAHVFSADTNAPVRVCAECLDSCDSCGAACYSGATDLYDDGWSTCNNGQYQDRDYADTLCIDCVEKACSECECIECTCPEPIDCGDTIEERCSRGWSHGNYANAYETQDLEEMLADLEERGAHPEYRDAAIVGFFESYTLAEIGSDREAFEEAFLGLAGQQCVKAGYSDERADEYGDPDAEEDSDDA